MVRTTTTTNAYGNGNYIVVRDTAMDFDAFSAEVDRLIWEGFIPVGGVAIAQNAVLGSYLLQAMQLYRE